MKNVYVFSQEDVICSPLLDQLRQHHADTYIHSLQVAKYSVEIAKSLSLEINDCFLRSVLLHDIGKLLISTELLDKKLPLEHKEITKLRQHPRYGLSLVGNHDSIDIDMILNHHENLDGTGYYGVTAQNLSKYVRILRVADSFDAMTNGRPYCRTRSEEEAIEELWFHSHSWYDAVVIASLEKVTKVVLNEFRDFPVMK